MLTARCSLVLPAAGGSIVLFRIQQIEMTVAIWVFSIWCWSHLQLSTKTVICTLHCQTLTLWCLIRLDSKRQCRTINATVLALKEVVIKPPVTGQDGMAIAHTGLAPSSQDSFLQTHVPCHVPYSTRVCVCENMTLESWKSHALSSLSLPNRLWLSESGAFLQFGPTTLLNHLHYLTVFPQRELQLSVSLSVSLIKADTRWDTARQKSPLFHKGDESSRCTRTLMTIRA